MTTARILGDDCKNAKTCPAGSVWPTRKKYALPMVSSENPSSSTSSGGTGGTARRVSHRALSAASVRANPALSRGFGLCGVPDTYNIDIRGQRSLMESAVMTTARSWG